MNVAAPDAVFSSQLGAAPPAVWAGLLDRGFIARYFGVALAPGRLETGEVLVARDAAGAAVTLAVTEARPPLALALRLQRDGALPLLLRWTIEACDGGSRLTVVHERAAAAPADTIAAQLALPLPALLSAPRVASLAALQAACGHLQGCTDALRALAAAMAAPGAHTRPAGGGFSLAEHLWHLADIEELGWAPRFERAFAEVRPLLPGVDGDRLAIERGYAGRPWRGATRRFIAQRRRTLRALARLDAAALQRPVLFAGRACPVGEMLAAMLAHDQEHRVEMAALWTSTRKA